MLIPHTTKLIVITLLFSSVVYRFWSHSYCSGPYFSWHCLQIGVLELYHTISHQNILSKRGTQIMSFFCRWPVNSSPVPRGQRPSSSVWHRRPFVTLPSSSSLVFSWSLPVPPPLPRSLTCVPEASKRRPVPCSPSLYLCMCSSHPPQALPLFFFTWLVTQKMCHRGGIIRRRGKKNNSYSAMCWRIILYQGWVSYF